MFRITVAIGDGPTGQWAFHFNTEDGAKSAFQKLQDTIPSCEITDDYGQSAFFSNDHVIACNIQDMAKMGDSNNALRLTQAKAELRYVELVEKDTDPGIKKAVQQQKYAEKMEQARRFASGGGMGGAMPMV